ncbi:MAG: tetratricopeptide repeat protein, partial [Anaerolineaceae bacterium]|nr:tetratricopeptide repeat protein [Anaerolineaceae bacterium]
RQALVQLIRIAPWDETSRCKLMRLLAAQGLWSEAQSEYLACKRYLAAELDLEPTPETVKLFEDIRRRSVKDERFLLDGSLPGNLPAFATRFIGRSDELVQIGDLLTESSVRLLSLIGPGGSGKTRLAVEAARDQQGQFVDGVWFVNLSGLDHPSQVPLAVAAALGINLKPLGTPEEQLCEYFRSRSMLLLLDNFEHLIPAAAWLAELLSCAAGMLLMVTSRQRLELVEEHIYHVPRLGLPTYPLSDPEQFRSFDALQMFIERLGMRNPALIVGPQTVSTVQEICQVVNGYPLGIELAASAAAIEGLENTLTGIKTNLTRLNSTLVNLPDRHRGLQASFNYSYNLLDASLQKLLAGLSVFRGGFDLAAAQYVCGATLQDLDRLSSASLIEKSLDGRWSLYELNHQFVYEVLVQDQQNRVVFETAHARYFRNFLVQQWPAICGADPLAGSKTVVTEIDNLRSAWAHMVAGCQIDALCEFVDLYFQMHDIFSWYQEAVDALSLSIESLSGCKGAPRILLALYNRLGWFHLVLSNTELAGKALSASQHWLETGDNLPETAFFHYYRSAYTNRLGDKEATRMHLNAALDIYHQLGDLRGISMSSHRLAVLNFRLGQVDKARQQAEESLQIARESGNQRLFILPLDLLGDIQAHYGNYDAAVTCLDECLQISRRLGDQYKTALELNNLGTIYFETGKLDQAHQSYLQCLDICNEIGDLSGAAIACGNLSEIATTQGDCVNAIRLALEGLKISRQIQSTWDEVNCLAILAEAQVGSKQLSEARAHILEGVKLAIASENSTMINRFLLSLGAIEAHQGRLALAADILNFLRQDPGTAHYYLKKAEEIISEFSLPAASDHFVNMDELVQKLGLG